MNKEVDNKNGIIIQHLADGKTYKEISAETGIKYRTIVARVEAMKEKHHCKTIPQLVLKVIYFNLTNFFNKSE